MQNVTTKLTGSKLHITVDLAAEPTRSASGKTEVIASTRGNTQIERDGQPTVFLGLNVYQYPKA